MAHLCIRRNVFLLIFEKMYFFEVKEGRIFGGLR